MADGNGILRVREWKHHWSSAMSQDGQILHATFFPRHIPQDMYRIILGAAKPNLRDSDWPTVEGQKNPLQDELLRAEKRCADSLMPARGVRWSHLMALINCTISPISFLLLISEGMTCGTCNVRRTFEQVSMKAIKETQTEDPLVCTVCEGIQTSRIR